MLRIGVVSDTHGQVDFTRAAVAMLESCGVKQVIHCGDIDSVEVVSQFAAWPTHFVFGNCDDNREELRQAMVAGNHICHGRQGELRLEGRRIAFLHGDDTRLLGDLVSGGEYDLVCHGHTHVARHVVHGQTHVLNPGALYRAAFHSLALLDLPALEVTLIKL
ncbi:MAG TPA: YfcE family phosphodiesterase [Pirellulales bacterium]|nr:YfcE family phosphodiesterase [Pirellulales bacterium]